MEGIILVDADVVIDYFNGIATISDAIDVLIKNDASGIPSITLFELFAGIEGKKRLSAIETIAKSAIILPLNAQSAYQTGKIYTILKKEGKLIGNQDILIAGIAMANNLPLLTRNIDHFQRIKDLRIISPQEVKKLIPMALVLKEQLGFHSKEWVEAEKEASFAHKKGKTIKYNDVDEMLRDLDR